MVVLVGQVARHQIDREAFQEVDFRKMYAPLAKWVTQIDMAERVPELLNQAFQVATSGRPGPVVVALPEDMLRDRAAAAIAGPYRAVRAHPGAADLAEMRRLLAARRAADHAGRRQRVERPRLAADIAISRGERSAGVLLVPPPGHRRQPAAVLCRRSRHRRRAGPGRAVQSRRSGARGRRPDRRDHLAILYADGHPRPGQDADPCACCRRGIGPRVPPDAGDPVRHARIRRRGAGAGAGRRRRAGATGARRRAPNTRPGSRRASCRQPLPALDLGADHGWLRERLPDDAIVTSTPAISAAGRTAFCNTAAPAASSARPAARWATACRPRLRPSSCIPTASSSGSAAMAAS